MAMTVSSASCCIPRCSVVGVSSSRRWSVRRENGSSPCVFLAPVLGSSTRDFLTGSSGHIESGKTKSKRAQTIAVRAVATEERAPPKSEDLSALKASLLAAVAGLDRGLVATKADENLANAIAVNLESKGGGVSLPEDLDKLQGKWRLVYSSGFSTGSFGGQRPGPQITRLPLISIGLVNQRIDVLNREFDNVVDLNLPTPWPFPPVQLTATLAHTFEIVGSSTIRIIFDKTIITPGAALSSLPPFEIPQFQLPGFSPPRDPRSGEFTSTYIDSDFRITRGDRGELRLFVRA